MNLNEYSDFEKGLIAKAKELGAIWAEFISPKDIITAEWTRLKCRYGCFNYGRLTCPPHSPDARTMRRILDSYQKCLLYQFSSKWNPNEEEDQEYLSDKMARVSCAMWHEEETRKRFNYALITLEREFFLEGYYKAIGIGAGPCLICGLKCNLQGPCPHPNEVRSSMEACGIDVYKTVRGLGRELSVASHPESRYNLFGLILIE